MAQTLGIKVKVDLPSKAQLENEFKEKWGKFKAEYTAKVNVAIDKNSMSKMSGQLKHFFEGKELELKPRLNLTQAMGEMTKFTTEFRHLREEMERGIHVKVKLDDMDHVGKTLSKNANLTSKVGGSSSEYLNMVEKTFEKAGTSYSKYVNKLSSGKEFETLTRQAGQFGEITQKFVDGEKKSEQFTANKGRALREIASVMKEINSLQINKAKSTDGQEIEVYNNRIRDLRGHLKGLQGEFRETFGSFSSQDSLIQEASSLQKMQLQLAKIGAEKKAQASLDKEVANALSEVVSLENKKYQLQNQHRKAGNLEKSTIAKQIGELEKRSAAISKSYDFENELNAKQKATLETLRQENRFRLENAKAAADDKAKATAQLEQYRELKSQLKDIHSLKRQISNIEGKGEEGSTAKELDKLRILKQEKEARQAIFDTELKSAMKNRNISKEGQEGIRSLNRAAEKQREMAAAVGQTEGKVAVLNHHYDELSSSISKVSRLQEEMSRSGDRESNVIREQISLEEKRQNAIRETISTMKKQDGVENQQRHRAIREQERQVQEEKHFSQQRKLSRERDQESQGMFAYFDPINAMQSAYGGFRTILDSVAEVDARLTEVAKVADAPQAELDKFSETIYDTASKVGKGADQYAESVARWVTTGKTLKESIGLAQDSVMGSFVGNIDEEDMVQYMSVPMNAWKDEMLDSKDVINSMNEVSNKNAIEMDDLGKAYQRAATTAANSGESFAQMTGMVTAAQEATRAGGEKIGTAMRAMDVNFGKISSRLQKGDIEKDDWFKNIGVNLKDGNGQLRSTYQICGDLAKVWGKLSKEQKSTAGFFAAGKQHSAVFAGMMNNWSTAVRATAQAQRQVNLVRKDQGSAFQEFAKQQKSVEFHMNNVKNSWGKFLNSFVGGRDGVNQILDAGNNVIKMMSKISENPLISKGIKTGAMIAGFVVLQSAVHKFGNTLVRNAKQSNRSLSTTVSKLKEVAASALGASAATDKLGHSIEKSDQKRTAHNTADELEDIGEGMADMKGRHHNKNKKVGKMDRFIDGVGGFFGNSVPFGTGNVGKVAAEAEQGASKLGKLAGVSTKVAGGFAKIAGGALKCVPVIGNVLEVMGLLEAFGFHPFEAVVEGFESLTGHATNVKKAMKEVAETNEKLAKKVQNNDFFNGNDLEKKKTGENYQSILDQARKNADDQNREHAELGDGIVIKPHLEPEEFDTFQRDFNKFAKDNDVDIRIRVNDYDSIMQKVKDLNKELAKTRQGDVADGLKNINKQLDNDKDTTSSKKLDEYLNDNKDYTKARDEIMAKQGAELSGLANAKDMSMKERSRKSEEIVKEYEKQMDELNQKWKSGENARAFWTSEAGEEIEKTHRKNAKSISEEIASMRKNLGDGAMSKEDFASSSKEDLNSMEVAQAGNLNQGFGKQTAQLDKINEKLANGKKLSAEELEVLAMQNSELVKKDQSTWGEDEVKQAQAASDAQRKYVDENKANQEQVMTDIMSANGKSREEIQKTIEAYEKGGSSYIKMMAKNGQLGMDIMKVSAEFASIYGDQWADKMGEIQDKVEAIPDEKITKYTFLDEDTGLVNTELISRLNNIPEEKMTKYGFQYDKDGNLNIDSLIDSLGKVPPELLTKYTTDGVLDAEALINDLVDHADQVPPEIKMSIAANTSGFDEPFKNMLKEYEDANGKEATVKFLADNKFFGLKKTEVEEWLKGLDGKESKSKMSADNSDAKKKAEETKKKNSEIQKETNTTHKGKDGGAKSEADKAANASKKVPKETNTTHKGKDGGAKAEADKASNASKKVPKETNTTHKGNASVAIQQANSATSRINGVPKNTNTVMNGNSAGAQGAARGATSMIQGIPKSWQSIMSGNASSAISSAQSAKGAIDSIPSHKTTVIDVVHNVIESVQKIFKGGKSVAIEENAATINPAKSMSTAIGARKKLQKYASRDRSVSDTNKDARVSEDTWRYWDKELFTGRPLDQNMSKLEIAVAQAKDNMDKLIQLAKQRIDLDNKQISYQKSMERAKQAELNSIMGQLGKYGFRHSGNKITNLGHAKSLKGDNAQKANDLLSRYKSVFENLSDISKTIQSLNKDKWDQQQSIAENKKNKENKSIEKAQRHAELLSKTLSNTTNILSRKLSEIGGKDFEMKLTVSEELMNHQSSSVKALMNEFNRLSQMGFSDPEQAKKIQGNLESLKSEIISNADAVLKLRKEINETKIEMIASDLDKFTKNLSGNISNLKNNITNLKDGLLSGSKFSDLETSNLVNVDFNRKTTFQKDFEERLKLEKSLDKILDLFAQKNVDRTKKVANAQLKIEQNKFNQLLGLAKAYSNGKSGNANLSGKDTGFGIDTVKIDKELGDMESRFMKASKAFSAELNKLKSSYEKAMSSAVSSTNKEALTQQFILDQMKLQEKIYKEIIAADREGIAKMREKLKLQGLTTDQMQKIQDSISNYEKDIENAQNSIKSSVKDRFDYEADLFNKQMDKYKSGVDQLNNFLSLAKTLNLNNEKTDVLYKASFASQYTEYVNYLKRLNDLRKNQSLYDTGSYEYNLLEKEIKDVFKNVESLTSQLIETNKKQYTNQLDGLQKEIEKSITGGKTLSDLKFDNETWIKGVQKELELEKLREKSRDLENETIKKRLEALDAQKEISKVEADYLEKQIDVLDLQEKLEKAKGKKDVQVLTRDENGNFNWGYEAKQDDVDKVKDDLDKAKGELDKFATSKKEEYLSKIGQIISGAKDGSLTPEEVKSRLAQLTSSYGEILKDIPSFDSSKLEDIIKIYDDYVSKNKGILDEYGNGTGISSDKNYEAIVNGFGEQFKIVSKDLGDIFGKELREALLLPQIDPSVIGKGNTMIIEHQTIELPNVTDAAGFEEVFRDLPDIARQVAQGK